MITIYSECESSRLSYTLEVIFQRCLGTPFRVVADMEAFEQSPQPRINYSNQPHNASLRIVPHALLFETHIGEQAIEMEEWNGIPCFFRTDEAGAAPFDIFAAAFYLISRYEEYLCKETDHHGRFPSSASLAVRHGFLERPVVNEWATALADSLTQTGELPSPEQGEFQFISTIDVDMAYRYKNKGFRRTLGGLSRDLLAFEFGKVKQRMRVLRRKEQDPYDNFDIQRRLHRQYPINRVYFILLGEHGKFDKNIRPDKPDFIHLLQHLSEENTLGIHPSYASNDRDESVKKEIHLLETITQRKVKYSRQHFLKTDIRKTFDFLEKEGIRGEFSMGYSDRVGFRAGICQPYPFFNLPLNEPRELLLYPFAIMDVALMRFMKMTPQAAYEKIKDLMEKVQACRGVFISVFHNESLCDCDEWTGWLQVYGDMIKLAVHHHDPLHTP